ncbi:hypothetical protein SS50377_27842 [Spironucleus salmonicida]|uniref:Uncharacterized protein n=1 Tax=Spironucleus salmonicida TaxID=348837 RepID=V6LX72_9EUKA|nr:hypothetical protein SS50377_27842 [Spironucleus salmonicida]|eukprot:EST48843.1 Hypothetical protein SS50377_10939 [Spironucleus salmonicida]
MFSGYFQPKEAQKQNLDVLALSGDDLTDINDFEPLEPSYITQSHISEIASQLHSTRLRITNLIANQAKYTAILTLQIASERQKKERIFEQKLSKSAVLARKFELQIALEARKSELQLQGSEQRAAVRAARNSALAERRRGAQKCREARERDFEISRRQESDIMSSKKERVSASRRSIWAGSGSARGEEIRRGRESEQLGLKRQLQSRKAELAELLGIEKLELEKSVDLKKKCVLQEAKLLGML